MSGGEWRRELTLETDDTAAAATLLMAVFKAEEMSAPEYTMLAVLYTTPETEEIW